MPEAFIVDAVRTPVGRRGGGLAAVHPADLGAHVITALLARTQADPLAVDDVVFGCVDTVGPQAGDIARTAWLAAGLPEAVPGVTVDRQCGSSQQAVHFAAQAVLSGTADLVVAGGVQNMSMIPIARGDGPPYRPVQRQCRLARPVRRRGDLPVPGGGPDRRQVGDRPPGDGAVRAGQPPAGGAGARRGRVRRRDRAVWRCGGCQGVAPRGGAAITDECPRRDTTVEKMAALTPLRPGGLITAALSSQIADGAAALLIASARGVREHGLRPRARIAHLSARGDDPVLMLTAPIAATGHALRRAGMSLDEIDLVEINEAFASVVLAWQRETGADLARVNACGGAIALGHPLGATGARLLTTLVHALERTGGRYGMVTMCEGGGQANVTIIERL